jgi:hypothetical protein
MHSSLHQLMRLTLLLLAALPAIAQAQFGHYGRFLPGLGGIPGIVAYGNAGGAIPAAPIQFDRPVDCPDCGNVGEIRFDYDSYVGAGRRRADGGAVLSGGFFQSPDFVLAPGRQLAWVQTVIATVPGTTDWRFPAGTSDVMFPDAAPTSPRYQGDAPYSVRPPLAAPEIGFRDGPNRLLAQGAQSWLAELGLVCILDPDQDGISQAYVLNTFQWGFNVIPAPNNAFLAIPPLGWGAPTAGYLATLNEYYDGSPPLPADPSIVTGKFHFQAGCDDCFINISTPVPEPAGAALLALGLASLFLARLRLRRRRAGHQGER